MEAIEKIIRLDKAETIQEMDDAMMDLHETINRLHLEKLQQLEHDVSRRLGVRSQSAFGNVGVSEAPRDEMPKSAGRQIRDEPQA
jgi:hypothetical protein